MYLDGHELHIESKKDRRIAYVAAMAANPVKPSPLPKIESLKVPFSLSPASARYIKQGLANIALDAHGVTYDDVSPAIAYEKLTELYGEIGIPEDFTEVRQLPLKLH